MQWAAVYRTLLVERGDFTGGTSSRSTKLIHGGVRYLRQRRVQMVYGALRERHRLWRNAPHLVDSLPLVVPAYRWWERPYYGVGLMVYDALAGRRGLGRSRVVGKRECARHVSTARAPQPAGGCGLPRRPVRRRTARLDTAANRGQLWRGGPELRRSGRAPVCSGEDQGCATAQPNRR